MTTRAAAIVDAGRVLARARATFDERTPREAAEAAWVPGGPSVSELETRIRERRGLPPLNRTA